MPRTLTPQQFQQARPGGSYKRYLSYLSRRRGYPVARPKPPSPRELARRDVLPGIRSAATALSEALLSRASRDVAQINARSSAIGGALQPFAGRAAGYYGQIQGNEAALGGALQGSLTGLGSSLGADIGGKLGGIQAPAQAVSEYGAGTATMGAQSGQAVGALSSADLQRLQSQGTAEQVYASALPRLAALAGEQERRGVLQQYAQTLAEQQAELSYREQSDLMEARRYYQERRIAQRQERYERRAAAKQERYERAQAKRAYELARQAVAYEMGQDLIKNTQAQQRIELAIRTQNESEQQFRAREARLQRQFQIGMEAARKAGGKPHAALSAKYGYIVDSSGKAILGKNGKRIPVRSDSSAAPWKEKEAKK